MWSADIIWHAGRHDGMEARAGMGVCARRCGSRPRLLVDIPDDVAETLHWQGGHKGAALNAK